jgi:DNA-binding IclR family transcriptional regulator
MTAGIVKSAERALAVLEHFRRTQSPATASELARALGLPQSSASMLLRSLARLGYLDYAPHTRAFMPTLRVALLGEWLAPAEVGAGPLTQRLKALQRATGETVILGRQNGPHVQYLTVMQQDQGVQLNVRSGVLRPMTLAAIGQILLTTRPDAEVRGIIRRNNADAATPALRVGERSFLAQLQTIRRRGYAESDAAITPGASVIAMLAASDGGGRALAIGVGGPVERISKRRDRIVSALAACVAPAAPAPRPRPRQGQARAKGLSAQRARSGGAARAQ